MSTRFVNVDRDTPMMLPPDLRDWVAKDDIVHFIIDAVELLDLREFKISFLEKEDNLTIEKTHSFGGLT